MKPRTAAPEPRASLLLLLGAVIAGAALLALGLAVHDQEARSADKYQILENQARRASADAPRRLETDRNQAGLYQHIRNQGFLGEENRAAWITALGQLRTEFKLDSLAWRLEPRALSSKHPGLALSRMDLTASRLDTAGLEALLGRLRELAPGRFTVEHCALNFESDGKRGQAECGLAWWTWNDPATSP
ncbi:MAG TPA: hypothetical protein PLL19_00180 [Thiobacillaceae bacterium]|nr:hypothetical protein [Thiobacillaceae bacterium]HNF87713.1 hypothetical protein [Thiobacillaceae bacterium]HNH88563.1 hypothetical protein [Thiobacillaceae bacterium]HNI06744.1 hypothetical protein [Thiobacillaceae bacterium]